MEYRTLPRGGEKISVIGLGGGYIGEGGEKETRKALELAVSQGVRGGSLCRIRRGIEG